MRAELQRIAEHRGENLSVILREAAIKYIERHPNSIHPWEEEPMPARPAAISTL
jgi:hypothetical protein